MPRFEIVPPKPHRAMISGTTLDAGSALGKLTNIPMKDVTEHTIDSHIITSAIVVLYPDEIREWHAARRTGVVGSLLWYGQP